MKNRSSASTKVLPAILAMSILGSSVLPGLGALSADAAAAGSYVTLSSFSGHPAATITVSGGGFGAGETVLISAVQGTATVATTTVAAGSDGNFSAPITLPLNLSQGNVAINAVGKSTGDNSSNGYYAVPFSPQLSVSSASTTPFGNLTVSGSGYGPNETVDLNFSGSMTKVQADAKGNFPADAITTPNLPAGSYQLMAVGEGSGAAATAYEYINGFYPSAYPSSYFVMPGQTLGFSGSGFAPGETVSVTDPKTNAVLTTFKTAADGSFTNAGTVTIPFSAAGGSANFGLVGSLSHAATTVSTGVGQYYPSASPSIYYALPGQSLSFYGSGFLAGETVQISDATGALTTATADKYGDLTMAGNVTIPVSAAGTTAMYTLKGLTSLGTATVSLSVGNFNPTVSPSSYYATPGSSLSFTGSGFAPGETVNVMNGKTVVSTIVVDKNGGFTSAGAVMIPYNVAGGSASYTLVGASSKASVGVSVGVAQMQTQISPSAYYVLPYSPFSAGVTGFVPGEKIDLTIAGAAVATVTADKLGNATFPTIVAQPNAKGSAALVATGETSAATASVSIALGAYVPSITSSMYYTQPGSVVTIAGSGFAPNEAVTITNASSTTPTATGNILALGVVADAKGMFSAPVTLPFGQTANSLKVVATGTLSGATSSTTITLAPFSIQVSPSTYYATPGSPVSFNGSGFVAGETVAMTLNGANVGTFTADAKGNLTVPASALPYAKAATYTFTGAMSQNVSSVSVGLAQFYAGIELNNYYGNGGSTVTVSGSGFASGESVQIMSGKNVLTTTVASSKGAISVPVTVPYAAPSDIKITASGALSGATATTGFTIAQVYSSMQLGAYAVPAGKAVTLAGSGYLPNEPITVTSDRGNVSYTTTADKNGNVNDSGLVLPAGLTAGNLKLTFNGTYSYTTNTITMYVQ